MTHDATTAPGPVTPEAQDDWADVKTPGDGRTYMVGTTHVRDTQPANNPTFSDFAVSSPDLGATGINPVVFQMPGSNFRQVVILQCVDSSTGAIQWQRYFHGETTSQAGSGNGFSNNGRGISVFPGPTPEETRIAICGETFDGELPLGQATNTNFPRLEGQSGGFIAVYDGAGTLLWSWLFFGDTSDGHCAITDVSIRVEGVAPNETEVVTWCGASSFGQTPWPPPPPLPPDSTLRDSQRFLAPGPTPGCAGANPADGGTHNSSGNWDGIVGRLTRAFPGGAPQQQFLSTVGGGLQDGLFGLAEIDADLFVVVGATTQIQLGFPTSPFTFPVTGGDCISSTIPSTDGAMGTMLLFNAAATRVGGNLLLVSSRLVGPNPQNEVGGETWLRDVAVVGDRIFVVGSTTDPALPTSANAFQPSLAGPCDGLIGATRVSTMDILGLEQLSYFGGANEDGLTGIAVWSEYPDHVAVTGWSGQLNNSDTVTASIWLDTANTSTNPDLVLIRQHAFIPASLTGNVIPTAVGDTHALNQQFQYQAGDVVRMRTPGGGGIAVAPSFRATVAGSTNGGVTVVGAGRPYSAPWRDGVRMVLDLLPPGVCRTDGTGVCPGAPAMPPAGFTGATTPTCALPAFGNLISVPAQPAPDVQRILIDFQGANIPGSDNVALILDRPPPPPTFNLQGTYLMFDFVDPSIAPFVVEQVEIWMLQSPVFFAHPAPGASSSIRFPIGPLPMQSGQLTAQFFSALTSTFAITCTQGTLVGSPALTLTW